MNPVKKGEMLYQSPYNIREGLRKIVDAWFSTKKKNMGLKHWILSKIILRHTYFFQFLGGGTLLSLDLGQTFKAL